MAINFTPYRTGNQVIDRNLDQLKSTLAGAGVVSRPVWTPAPLGNGWIQGNSTTIPALAPCAYNLSNGVVYGKGWVINGTGGALSGVDFYVLPVGMRPLDTREFCGRYNTAGSDFIIFFDVQAGGNVHMHGSVASAGLVSLEFSFQAEQ